MPLLNASLDLRTSRPLLGLGLITLATMLFATQDVASKYLLETYDVPLVAAIRYLTHTLIMIAILAPRHGDQLIATRRPALVAVRGLCLVVATFFMGLALQRLPLAETTAIIYLAPIFVVLLARPLLGEKIGLLGWLAAGVGFIGMMLIVRPGGGLDPAGVAFALCNVVAAVAYFLLSRILSANERTLALLFYSALVGAICFGLVAPWFWFDAVPDTLDLAVFASLGIFAGLGHWCFTAANRYAPASLLAPMAYMHLLWAGLLGLIVFGEIPPPLGLAGMGIIAGAGVMTALRSRVRVRPA